MGSKSTGRKDPEGDSVDWIGARISLVREGTNVTDISVTIREEKATELLATIEEFLAKKLVDRVTLREFADPTPVVKPYCQMVWAAVGFPPSAGEGPQLVAVARIKLALQGLRKFAVDGCIQQARLFPMREVKSGPVVAFDASLTGGGAISTIQGRVQQYISMVWTDHDHFLGAMKQDPAWQATWEAYALLVALFSWRKEVAEALGTLMLHGDAQGVLQAVVARRGKSPMINAIVAEAQLALGRSMHSVAAAHFWSEENATCDALSRLREGGNFPNVLGQAIQKSPAWRLLLPSVEFREKNHTSRDVSRRVRRAQ